MSPIIFLISLKASRGWANKVNTKKYKAQVIEHSDLWTPQITKYAWKATLSKKYSKSQPTFLRCLFRLTQNHFWARQVMVGHPRSVRYQAKSSAILRESSPAGMGGGGVMALRWGARSPSLHFSARGPEGADSDRPVLITSRRTAISCRVPVSQTSHGTQGKHPKLLRRHVLCFWEVVLLDGIDPLLEGRGVISHQVADEVSFKVCGWFSRSVGPMDYSWVQGAQPHSGMEKHMYNL